VERVEAIVFAFLASDARTPSSERRSFRARRTSGSDFTSSVSRERALQLT
jgi:hypothetical protein